MALLQLGEGIGHSIQGIRRRDRNGDRSRSHKIGHFGKDLGSGGGRAALGLHAQLLGLLERCDRLDAVVRNAQLDCELDVFGPEEVDERIDSPFGRRGRRRSSEPVAVGHGDGTVRTEPVCIRRRGNTQDLRTTQSQELDHHGPYPARRRRDGDRLPCFGINGTYGRIGGAADDVEGPGNLPAQLWRLVDQLRSRDRDVGGMAGAAKRET